MKLLECRSKVFCTLIWSFWNVDQRSSLLQSGIAEISIKGLLYFNLKLLKWQSKVFFTSIWTTEMSIKCVLYFWIVEMSIKGLLYFNLELLSVKSQNLGLDFKCWVHRCSIALGWVIFICSFLILNFIKKFLIDKRFYFWETFDFWNLEVLKLTFNILRLWNFEILNWNLDLEIWNFEI